VIGVLYADEIVLVWSTSLGQLIKIINDNQMNYVVDQLIEFLGGKEDELRDIAGLGTCNSRFYSCIYADELDVYLHSTQDYHLRAPSRRQDHWQDCRKASPSAAQAAHHGIYLYLPLLVP
jgi:hypothetical protein